MTRPKYKQPLESFDPRMIELLLRGARERFVIPFPNEHGRANSGKAKAVVFQRRLHTLRARMRDANHPQAVNVSRAYVRLLWGVKAVREGLLPDVDEDLKLRWMGDIKGELGAFIVINRMDAEFDEVLSSLGLGGGPPIGGLPEAIEVQETTSTSIDDLLDQLPEKD